MRESQQAPEPKRPESMTVTRRGILIAGVPALSALYSMRSARSALAAHAPAAVTASPPSVPNASEDLMRGGERRYNAPLLTPGTRLVLPADIKAVSVQNYYRRPHLASVESAWPRVTASDGTTVDASIVPDRGAPTRIAVLSGFTEGWYEIHHASGRADRVTWDARGLPVLWLYGEFGATRDAPYRNRFYTLALEPFSRNPYSRNRLAA